MCGGDVRSPPGGASSTGLPAVSGERIGPWCGEIELRRMERIFGDADLKAMSSELIDILR